MFSYIYIHYFCLGYRINILTLSCTKLNCYLCCQSNQCNTMLFESIPISYSILIHIYNTRCLFIIFGMKRKMQTWPRKRAGVSPTYFSTLFWNTYAPCSTLTLAFFHFRQRALSSPTICCFLCLASVLFLYVQCNLWNFNVCCIFQLKRPCL